MKQIIIGRHGNQPFPIQDDTVSGQHAIFTFDETTGLMYIQDNGSTNGTFIKRGGGPFVRAVNSEYIDQNCIIRLGPRLAIRPAQLLAAPRPVGGGGVPQGGGQRPPQPPQPPKPVRVDIAHLRFVSEQFEREKLRIQQAQARLGGLRQLSMIGSMSSGVIGGAITLMVGEETKVISLAVTGIVSVALICLWFYCDQKSKGIPEQSMRNEKQYKLKYCCPKCKRPLHGQLYENVLAIGKCNGCKAEFYDSSLG